MYSLQNEDLLQTALSLGLGFLIFDSASQWTASFLIWVLKSSLRVWSYSGSVSSLGFWATVALGIWVVMRLILVWVWGSSCGLVWMV